MCNLAIWARMDSRHAPLNAQNAKLPTVLYLTCPYSYNNSTPNVVSKHSMSWLEPEANTLHGCDKQMAIDDIHQTWTSFVPHAEEKISTSVNLPAFKTTGIYERLYEGKYSTMYIAFGS